ncbi:MAG TPA: VOC family protein [Candidatus Limnocylindrales bacterium]|nr:VOC family protein [Candidatus Limnocylindrales bacterium]
MTSLATCLWFDGDAEAAARLYTSLLPDSRIDRVVLAPADNPSTKQGEVLTVDFTLAGQRLTALNGGPDFRFTEAISLVIECEDQAEVDRLWTSLILGGGEPGPCGWLKDRFGLSWQIVPRQLNEMLAGPDAEGAKRVMEAMLQMGKLDLARLREAYQGEPVRTV